jgi:dienelactone hydrolase
MRHRIAARIGPSVNTNTKPVTPMPHVESGHFMVGSAPFPVERYLDAADAARRPAVVLLHGVDGLDGPSGAQLRSLSKHIAADGYLVALPRYFDAADGSDTDPLELVFERRVPRLGLYGSRVAAAVADAIAHRNADTSRVAIIGVSLGGGLALDYAETGGVGRLKALVDYFGYIGDSRILANVGLLPPTLVLHNAADDIVRVATSSALLLQALDGTSVVHEHEYYTEPHPETSNHTFKPGGESDVKSRARTLGWLKKYVKGAA